MDQMLPQVGTYSELSNLDYALTQDGDRVALYRVDQPSGLVAYRVWSRADDRAVQFDLEAEARTTFGYAVESRGGRI